MVIGVIYCWPINSEVKFETPESYSREWRALAERDPEPGCLVSESTLVATVLELRALNTAGLKPSSSKLDGVAGEASKDNRIVDNMEQDIVEPTMVCFRKEMFVYSEGRYLRSGEKNESRIFPYPDISSFLRQ